MKKKTGKSKDTKYESCKYFKFGEVVRIKTFFELVGYDQYKCTIGYSVLVIKAKMITTLSKIMSVCQNSSLYPGPV